MTDNTPMVPTDAEIIALMGDPRYSTIGAVREAISRWGQPAHSGEPVARLEIGKTKGGVSLTHIAEPAAFQLPEGMYALYTTPQPVEREPLTDEQIKGLIEEGVFFGNCKEIVRAIEAAHGIGIKGGKHGADT